MHDGGDGERVLKATDVQDTSQKENESRGDRREPFDKSAFREWVHINQVWRVRSDTPG